MSPFVSVTVITVACVLLGFFTYGVGLILLPVYYQLVFKGTIERAIKAEQKLHGILMQDETCSALALQFRLFALLNRRELVAITSSRIITVYRSIFGGFTMRDYQWKDLQDVQLSENILPAILGSRLVFKFGSSIPWLIIDGISSEAATVIYTFSQAQEQAWEEKRRIRAIEETRAASGGITMGNTGPMTGAAAFGGSLLEELDKAKKLFDIGAISDAEFQEIKSKILSRPTL